MLPPLSFRHIAPSDKAALAAGLACLSPETQRRRFLTPKPRLSSAELRYLTEIDGFDHVAIVAVSATDPDVLLGVARFVRLTSDPATAEAAVVVCDALQGLGLGRELGRRLAAEARVRGVRRITATLLSDNEPAQRLFASITSQLVARDVSGLRELTADLAA